LDPDRPRSSLFQLAPSVVALLLFGIFSQLFLTAFLFRLPKRIFFEPSFTIGLLELGPIASAFGMASVAFVAWLFSPFGRGHLDWSRIDSSGGLRWPILGAAMALAWAYSGYGYNYYLGQTHLWDRLLIVALMFGILRSPFLIPLLLFEVLVSRAQFDHPLITKLPIGDELPLRVLAIVFGCALWNGLVDGLAAFRSSAWAKRLAEGKPLVALRSLTQWKPLARWLAPSRIPTHALVFSILCMIAFYYSVAGIGKLMLGANALDWLRDSHMENLFISSHLNGWLSFLSEARALEIAEVIRVLHLPIAIMTLTFELGMAFILVRQRGTLLILAAISAMHVGIVISSGIVFWKWLTVDLAMLVWLWLRRDDQEIALVYSKRNALLSLIVIGGLVVAFDSNQFAWWNTKWTMLYEVEVLDEEGEVYRVDRADFSPYALFDVYKPRDRENHTYAFGMTVVQEVMQFFEEAGPEELKRFGRGKPGRVFVRGETRGARVFSDFMIRHFRNRNGHPSPLVAPFLFPAPALHNRFSSGPNLYRGQKPVVEVRLRFKEVYYTGSELQQMRDEVIYSAPIPPAEKQE
jgi:hypothetical protein